MDLDGVVRSRHMTREFLSDPIEPEVFESCVDLASRSPSAGKSQGWSLVVLEGASTRRYWDLALPPSKRETFAFPGLLNAPLLAIVCADPDAYLRRYSEPDKQSTGLGGDAAGWPAPYWTIDAAFATMTLLLALEDARLGALFFAHSAERAVRSEFAIPDRVEILGILAVGHPDPAATRAGRSAARPRRRASGIIHTNSW